MKTALYIAGVAFLFVQPAPRSAPVTFMGHQLGESYEQFRARSSGTVDPNGSCVNSDDTKIPASCYGFGTDNRHAVYTVHPADKSPDIEFYFLDGHLVKIERTGCGAGEGQVYLLTQKFGHYTAKKTTPYQNGFGARWVDTTWYWHITPTSQIEVYEGNDPTVDICGDQPFVEVSFGPREAQKKAVNPY